MLHLVATSVESCRQALRQKRHELCCTDDTLQPYLRVELANANGLDCTTEGYHHAAVNAKYGDIATLRVAARKLGMANSAEIMVGAAERSELAEVQYLHRQGCPWPGTLLEKVASSGHFELLRWCHEHGLTGIANARMMLHIVVMLMCCVERIESCV
jgi:hypothetical protein